MFFTGFADEGAKSFAGQLAVTQALGWHNIESRAIDGINIHDLSDEAFEKVVEQLDGSGVKINCFGSTIANWGKSILKEEDFERDIEQSKRAIVRMKRLGTKTIRIMSYLPIEDRGPDDQMREKRFERLNTIVKMFLDEGLQPLHENCRNYGGMGWSYTLDLLDNVPGLKLIFDTGNPVFTSDYTKSAPYPKQSSWEFWRAVRDHVEYIHIKDAKMVDDKTVYQWCGEGDGDVQKILDDAFARGYDGGISIEPHLGLVFHDSSVKTSEEFMHDMYIEYGHRIEKIVQSACQKAGRPFAPEA